MISRMVSHPHLPPALRFCAASNPLPLSRWERRTRSASEGKGVGEGEAEAKRLVRGHALISGYISEVWPRDEAYPLSLSSLGRDARSTAVRETVGLAPGALLQPFPALS